ncbi:HAD family hydrolase [uncultured Cohaesibacter sp.]|uniref:HAD family hydrolase n=1 Tax=uncultured Cohaesibacter sp. TaxID=1002546 RepID=UPI0029C8AB8F|nr:HAD family hydrolase [uncultured Cohaesibacter sp.]
MNSQDSNTMTEPGTNPAPLPERIDAATALLARQLAPILLCDKNEPFEPAVVGISHLKRGEPSPSFHHKNPFTRAPNRTNSVLEYAIWWNGDIQHLYELDHVWIYLNENNSPIHITASAHGEMIDISQSNWQDRQIRLFCEPGKHALAPTSAEIIEKRAWLDEACSSSEQIYGFQIPDAFKDHLSFLSPYDHFLACDYLRGMRFQPSYRFEKSFDLSKVPFVSWNELETLIPRLLRDQTEELRKNKRGIKAVFLDTGDTLIDEGTRIYSEDRENLILSAKPIETSRQLLDGLKERGYLLALIGDGLEQSFHNVLKKNGFWDYFDVVSISENCGITKPSPRIFIEAMMQLGLRKDDTERMIMLGDNLSRDIRGANALGMTTVWIDWAPRHDKEPKDDLERPDYRITRPIELLDIIDKLESEETLD